MNTRSLRIGGLALIATLIAGGLTGCVGGDRTVNSNTRGTLIPSDELAALGPGLTAEDWLTLAYGTPDRRAMTEGGGEILTWVFTRTVREIRPNQRTDRLQVESHVELDAEGDIVRTWDERTEERID